MSALLSRKFILAVLSLVSASVLCWFGRVDAGVYSVVVVSTVGAYIAGNVTQKAAAKNVS